MGWELYLNFKASQVFMMSQGESFCLFFYNTHKAKAKDG